MKDKDGTRLCRIGLEPNTPSGSSVFIRLEGVFVVFGREVRTDRWHLASGSWRAVAPTFFAVLSDQLNSCDRFVAYIVCNNCDAVIIFLILFDLLI